MIGGSTPDFDYVCNEAAKGVSAVALKTGVPTVFGILTVDTIEQAIERAGTKPQATRAGEQAAAIEMANLTRALKN